MLEVEHILTDLGIMCKGLDSLQNENKIPDI